MTLRSEEHDAGFGAGDREFDPALFFIELLVGEDTEAQLFRIEGEGAVLVGTGTLTNLIPLIIWSEFIFFAWRLQSLF
jgi:hypothetical protein